MRIAKFQFRSLSFLLKLSVRINQLIKFWLQINQIPRHSVQYIVWMCENAAVLNPGGGLNISTIVCIDV